MKYHNIEWRNDYLILVAIILVALAVVLLPGWIPVQAATPTPEPPDTCPVWKTAGLVEIHRCEDDDYGVVCYVPVAGVMQCLRP